MGQQEKTGNNSPSNIVFASESDIKNLQRDINKEPNHQMTPNQKAGKEPDTSKPPIPMAPLEPAKPEAARA